MARPSSEAEPIAEYIALALLRNNPPDGSFVFQRGDFSGDSAQLLAHAEMLCGFTVSESDVSAAIRTLADCGLVRVTDDPYSGTFIKIKSSGAENFFRKSAEEFASAERDDDEASILTRPSDYPAASAVMKHPLLEDYNELGSEWLTRALAGIAGRPPVSDDDASEDIAEHDVRVPASDRLVTIDHNSQAFREVVEVTEAADEAIRTSNSIAEQSREWIRSHIKLGWELIKQHKVLAGAVSALLLEPLLNAYDAVTEEPAKQAILAAINAVRSFFGI